LVRTLELLREREPILHLSQPGENDTLRCDHDQCSPSVRTSRGHALVTQHRGQP